MRDQLESVRRDHENVALIRKIRSGEFDLQAALSEARAEGAREERERLKDLAIEQGNRIAQDNTTGCDVAADAAQACWVKAAWIASQSNKEG